MASQKLVKILTTPSKLASKLNWRKMSGSVLNLDVHSDRIGMAVAVHPSLDTEAETLTPLRLGRRGHLDEEALQTLEEVVHKHNVCGIVVSWPVQTDTGRMGASCGRVLHALDEIVQSEAEHDIVGPNRPVCLWDPAHVPLDQEDAWGRNPTYCRTTDKGVLKASVERYHADENVVAAQVWDDFVRVHWPQIYNEHHQAPAVEAEPKPVMNGGFNDFGFDDDDTESSWFPRPSPALNPSLVPIENNNWDQDSPQLSFAC